uniref:Chitin-binding type-2 domain-containing protein n=1 Tax=Musca domestica TaxID=7370 RepID=A0A1I8MGA0_MUSDO
MKYFCVLIALIFGAAVGSAGTVAVQQPCSRPGFFPISDNSRNYYGCYANRHGGLTLKYLSCKEGQIFNGKKGFCMFQTIDAVANEEDVESPTIPSVPEEQPTTPKAPEDTTSKPEEQPTTPKAPEETTSKPEEQPTTPKAPEETTSKPEQQPTTPKAPEDTTSKPEEQPTTPKAPEDTTTKPEEQPTTPKAPEDSTTKPEEQPTKDNTTTTEAKPTTEPSTTTEKPEENSTTPEDNETTEADTTTEEPEIDTTTEAGTETTEDDGDATITEEPVTEPTTEHPEENTTTPEDETTTQGPEVETTTAGHAFNCPTTGIFPQDGSCDKFNVCAEINGIMTPFQRQCPEGQNFFPPGGYCTSEFSCDDTKVAKHTQAEEFECVVEGTFAYHSDCSKYFKCEWNSRTEEFLAQVMQCPSGQVYHILTGKCGVEGALTCVGRRIMSRFAF